MKIKSSEFGLMAIFVMLAVLIGALILSGGSSEADAETTATEAREATPTEQMLPSAPPIKAQNTARPARYSAQTRDRVPSNARPNERLVQFDNDEDYQNFLRSLDGSDLNLLGSLDPLRAAWVSFKSSSELSGVLDSESASFNYVVTLPLPQGNGQIQESAVPFNSNALEWLGITTDNSQWGRGVVVAVVDSGITSHLALPDNIERIDIVANGPSSPTAGSGSSTVAALSTVTNGHGTAVASLIAGNNAITPGVAPAVTLLDVRVAQSDGTSSSFQLAEGIIAAVDGGASVINVSLGSAGNSPLVESAVDYAYASGAVIVASSGNDGGEQPAFPAGYEKVYAVGAVDSEGTLVDFSNTGENLDLTAPGLAVFAAWTEDRYIEFTGTSASAPYVSAAIATAMSEFQLTASEAAEYILDYTNEAGLPGTDTSYGLGHLDVGRIIDSQTDNIYDIAAVSHLIETGTTTTLITVVQNQGTALIPNAQVTLSTPLTNVSLTVSSLQANEIQTFEVPISSPSEGEEFAVTTEVQINRPFQDSEPTNNIKTTSFDFSSEQ